MNQRSFFAELKRRNVYKVAVAYAVVAWLLIQIATSTFPVLEIPNWATKLVIALVVLGFPLALIFAWAFELTPEGIKRTQDVVPDDSITRRTGRKLMAGVAVLALIAAGLFASQLFRPAALKIDVETTASATIPAKSIAVLPFQNLSEDKNNAFFADGVQEEILTTLAKIADLKVISRTSVMQFREPEKRNLREIAQALNIAHVLEGSVQRSANRVRVTAQLIDARTDTHLWAERYDRDLADVFAIQTEVAQKIAGELQAVLSPREKAALQVRPTTDTAAYDLYLRAREIYRSEGAVEDIRDSTRRVVSLLDDAISRDPAFVPALCMLAQAHLRVYWLNLDHTPTRLELARNALETAARLQPDAAQVHFARALFHYWGHREYNQALAELELARRSLPNESEIVHFIGAIVRRQGRWEESRRKMEEAMQIDPRNPLLARDLTWTYLGLRRYNDAARLLDQALQWQPHEFVFAWPRAMTDVARDADLRSLRELLSSPAVQTASPERLTEARLTVAFYERDYARARDILARSDVPTITTFGFVTPRQWYEGQAAAGLGDHAAAPVAFRAAREIAATAVAARADDAKALMILAQIDARLGQKELAMKEAEQARALLPVEKDAFDGPLIEWMAAGVYAQIGEPERALDLLERSVQLPRGVSYGHLSLSDDWDSLRDHPRFDKLLKSLAPKEPK